MRPLRVLAVALIAVIAAAVVGWAWWPASKPQERSIVERQRPGGDLEWTTRPGALYCLEGFELDLLNARCVAITR